MIRLAVLLLALTVATAQARPLWLVDFVYLAEGHGPAEHDDFTENVAHIAARYGVHRLIGLERVAGFAHPGPIAPDRIDLWSLPDRAALTAWQNDPDRVWYEDLAGHILADRSSRYLALEETIGPIGPDGLYLVDIPRLRRGIDQAAAATYAADLARAGRPHGLAATASFAEISHISGPFGRVDALRLFHLPDLAVLDALLADPAYRQVETRRRDLYDFHGAARQLYRATLVLRP